MQGREPWTRKGDVKLFLWQKAAAAGAPKGTVLFVHGVGIREPNYARSAMEMLRREYIKATGDASAQADPYRWCAHYSGEGGNGSNCYFMTLDQCRATISGIGGYCRPNPFYTGPATKPRKKRKSR